MIREANEGGQFSHSQVHNKNEIFVDAHMHKFWYYIYEKIIYDKWWLSFLIYLYIISDPLSATI